MLNYFCMVRIVRMDQGWSFSISEEGTLTYLLYAASHHGFLDNNTKSNYEFHQWWLDTAPVRMASVEMVTMAVARKHNEIEKPIYVQNGQSSTPKSFRIGAILTALCLTRLLIALEQQPGRCNLFVWVISEYYLTMLVSTTKSWCALSNTYISGTAFQPIFGEILGFGILCLLLTKDDGLASKSLVLLAHF